ncbi:MAG TPA: beta-ketoacyl synthase N-terminal-like domain-containing protein, partial [Thermoanaerobaculia bacterium]|nr:beta-ketoacyl synthase N-terminal-like domain-containing protein [Thermoanaerobaculia bacterium]
MMKKRRRVVVTGAGVISELGDSPAQVHSALLGKGWDAVDEARGSSDGREAGEGSLSDFDALRYLGEGNLHPLDRPARLASAAVALAIEASGLTDEEIAEREAGLVLGTMFGGLR